MTTTTNDKIQQVKYFLQQINFTPALMMTRAASWNIGKIIFVSWYNEIPSIFSFIEGHSNENQTTQKLNRRDILLAKISQSTVHTYTVQYICTVYVHET